MFEKIINGKILFVIVLYKSIYYRTNTYISFLKDIKNLYIYDNSPSSQNISGDNIVYIHDPNNSGLSVAYNNAAKYAQQNGYKWVLLLDQDTTFEDKAIEKYLEAIEQNPDIKLFAPKHKIESGLYISPTKYHCKFSHPTKSVKTGITLFSEACPINSGMLIDVDAYWKVGGYDNEVILDFSDIRFIEKFRKYYDTFYIIDSTCIQNFSVNETDKDKLLNRFVVFCKCAKVCHRNNIVDSVQYFIVTLKRCVSLTLQTKSFSFIKTYIKSYLR